MSDGSTSLTRIDPAAIAKFTDEDVTALKYLWAFWARDKQLPPPGDWTTWLVMGGRGAGKTRVGAEWVRHQASLKRGPIALVGQTIAEAKSVMLRGPSGVLAVTPPDERPKLRGYELTWPNGTTGMILSASDPERFRGPQFAAAWCDEVGKWPDAEAAWDMLQFSLRLGKRPRQVATTTPRPTPLLKRLMKDNQTIMSRMTTRENNEHLADGFLKAVVARYRDSVLGRQELDGEMIEDREDALWTRDMFARSDLEPDGRVVVAVDPPVTANAASDGCGIVVAGRAGDQAIILADYSLDRAAPHVWAKRAVDAAREYEADAIVAETNQGGDLVASVIAQVDAAMPVRQVRATRGKWVRAEPVATLYARGLVLHRAGLTALEDEMCGFGADGLVDGHSPDRVDALVWALTELMLGKGGVPRVRRV